MSEENQNRNNRSRNNNGQNRNRGNGGQGQRNRNRNNNGNRNNDNKAHQQRNQLQPTRSRRKPKPKPLTFWQKVLKAIGLYKAPEQEVASNKKPNNQRQNRDNNNAQKNGRVAGGGRVDNKGGRKPKNQQARPSGANDKDTPPTVVKTPRLYVGNLSYDASEHDLEELFKGIGAVRNVELVYNRHTHKSKGYSFITMGNVEEAERAVSVLHDQPFMGRKMIVNGARSKGPANGGSEDRPRREGAKKKTSNSAPRKNINDDIPAEEEVHSLAPSED